MRLVQLRWGSDRSVALVDEPRLRVISGAASIHQLVVDANARVRSLVEIVNARVGSNTLEYDEIYGGRSQWRLLPPIDHPQDPARCLVTGTGLTHLGSSVQRQRMHELSEADLTDSMKMFKLGLEGGKPADGAIGVSPEWFYKGNGLVLRGHGDPLDVPAFAEDAGEEAEIAGLYMVDEAGTPWRVGMAIGNECSDHVFEKRNYLNLAGSKLRTCSIGPELVVDPAFGSVSGTANITRAGRELWSKTLATGEDAMCHSLRNIEHHHFKYDAHRRPGDVHVHFFGACAISFADGIHLADGDVVEVSFDGFGRPLRNPVRSAPPDGRSRSQHSARPI